MAKAAHSEFHFLASATVRDVVIGMSDGLTVPFALAAGLTGATAGGGIIVTAGVAEIAAGAVAMGLGGYLAARTDADLAEIFLPKARRFDQAELAELIRAFPEWVENLEGYALAMDFRNAAFEGLVINRDIWDERDQRVLCTFVGKTIAMLRTRELSVPA